MLSQKDKNIIKKVIEDYVTKLINSDEFRKMIRIVASETIDDEV